MTSIRHNLLNTCEIYVPSVDVWENSICITSANESVKNVDSITNEGPKISTAPMQVPPLLQPIKDFSMCQFQEEKLSVIVTGGLNDQGEAESKVMLFIDGTWKYVKQMNQTRKLHCSCRLPSGEILVAGKMIFKRYR